MLPLDLTQFGALGEQRLRAHLTAPNPPPHPACAPQVGSKACIRQAGRSGAFPQCLAPTAQRPELSRSVETGLAPPWRPPQGYQMQSGLTLVGALLARKPSDGPLKHGTEH
jgi:hypothetical protein